MNSKNGQSGFVLLKALMFIGISAVVVSGSYNLLNNRVKWMTIIRIQQRMENLKGSVENTGRSFAAFNQSASEDPSGSLGRCLIHKNCIASKGFAPFKLYDGLGRPISGTFNLNGEKCSGGACSINIETSFRIVCSGGTAACSTPSEIITRYSITKLAVANTTRTFAPIEGEVNLSTFSCPPDQYIHSITDDGQLQCAPAEISPYGSSCSPGTAAIGITEEGYMICTPMENFCKSQIRFSLVLDTSGSMNGRNIEEAKKVLPNLLNRLDLSRDTASFSTFASNASLRSEAGNSFGQIGNLIGLVRASGGTNMSAGLKLGAKTLQKFTNGKKVILFISDGFDNSGNSNPVAVAKKIKDEGTRIFTVALSTKADRNILRRIASSPPDFFYAADAADLDGVISEIQKVTCR